MLLLELGYKVLISLKNREVVYLYLDMFILKDENLTVRLPWAQNFGWWESVALPLPRLCPLPHAGQGPGELVEKKEDPVYSAYLTLAYRFPSHENRR